MSASSPDIFGHRRPLAITSRTQNVMPAALVSALALTATGGDSASLKRSALLVEDATSDVLARFCVENLEALPHEEPQGQIRERNIV
jgi:hypothetical protein